MTGFRSKAGLAIAALAILTGCSTYLAPKYTAVPDHINQMRDAGVDTVKLGAFTVDPAKGDSLNHLSIRGRGFESPYEASYANYLKESLRSELEEAKLLNPDSATELTGVLMGNDLNKASGPGLGNAILKARFAVKRDGKVRYDKVLSVTHEWKARFEGAYFIPATQENYSAAYQKLLGELFADPNFVAALKK